MWGAQEKSGGGTSKKFRPADLQIAYDATAHVSQVAKAWISINEITVERTLYSNSHWYVNRFAA